MLAAFLSGTSHVIPAGLSWVKFLLALLTLAGLMLVSRPLSLNIWQPSEGFHSSRDWVAFGTGIILLSSVSLHWYWYAQGRLLCWGFSGLPLLSFCLDVMWFALLTYYMLGMKPDSPAESGMNTE
jgi:hypothetical protein